MTPHAPHTLPACVFATDDGSPPSRRAAATAAGLASRFDIPLRPVHLTAEARHRVTVDDQLSLDHLEPDHPAVAGGPDRVDTLIAEAAESSALIVAAVPSIGRVRRRARALGRPLAMNSHLPWVAVGPGLRQIHRLGPEQLIIPLDGRPQADALVPTALSWATAFGLTVHLIAVVPGGPKPLRPPTNPSPQQQFNMDPDSHLQQLLDAQPHGGVEVKTDTLRDPIGVASAMNRLLRHHPDAVILAPATRHRNNRSFIDHNTPNSLLRHSPVPVLLIPLRSVSAGNEP